jgi:spore coat polysaccharide biosynthesis protein SpsF (cytidylyltransferase family)
VLQDVSVLAVVCVRDTSERLPHKWRADIAGAPLLAHVVARLRQSKSVRQVVVAVPSDKPGEIPQWAVKNNVPIVYGPESDVVARMAAAAKRHGKADDLIFRAMSDQPFLDWQSLDSAAALMQSRGWDFVLPLALSEPVYGAALSPWSMRAWSTIEAESSGEEREHVGLVLRKRLSKFEYGVRDVPHWCFRPSFRLEVDQAEDVRLANAVWAVWGQKEEPALREVVSILDKHPELSLLNSGVQEKTSSTMNLTRTEAEQWEKDLRGRPVVYGELGGLEATIAKPARCPKCDAAMVLVRLGADRCQFECASCHTIRTYRA